METEEYFDIWVLMWSTKFSTKEKVVGFSGLSFMGRVWVGVRVRVGSKVVFWAVFNYPSHNAGSTGRSNQIPRFPYFIPHNNLELG